MAGRSKPGQWDDPHGPTLVATLCEGDDRVCVIIHRGNGAEVRLPEGNWTVLIDTADDGRGGTVSGVTTVAARSVAILAADPRRRTGVSDETLDHLAAAAGIEPEWWTIDGLRHEVPRDTRLHILKALGLSCVSDGEARDALRDLAEQHDRRFLPFAHVHHGDGAGGGAATDHIECPAVAHADQH
ncbi:MAG: hypothetical protein WDN06_10790 [Asticcacaulis sp.]